MRNGDYVESCRTSPSDDEEYLSLQVKFGFAKFECFLTHTLKNLYDESVIPVMFTPFQIHINIKPTLILTEANFWKCSFRHYFLVDKAF